MGEEKDLSTTKKRGRPKSDEQSSSSNGRPKASSTANADGVTQKKKRPTGNSSKKAQVVAAATESANKANKAKSTSKSTINFDEDISPKTNAQVENNVQFDANVDASTTAGEVASGGIDASINVSSDLGENDVSNESLDMNGIESNDLNGDVNAEINADMGADISTSADLDLNVANEKDAINDDALSGEEESGLDLQDAQNENNLFDNEPQIEESGEEKQNEQAEDNAGQDINADKQEEVSELDLTVDDSELEQLKAKKKKKKRKGGGADLGSGINPDSSDEAGLQGKKQKKKKWWLLLLLLLLLLIGGLVFLFRDVLFPPKPIVIVPQGMIIDIKETGTNQFGMKEFIFKPGDTIEFNNALSVGSERTVEKEDGTKEELSPFSLRLRFYIEYQGEQYQAFIEDIHNSKDATIKKYNDWYYWYDIAIPGAAYKKIIESIKLSATGIGNVWQGREVKLVLEYQTVIPIQKTIDEDFEYDYDPEWAVLVTDIYDDYIK